MVALASCKADINAFGPTQTTALQSAVAKEDLDMITTLLDSKASTVRACMHACRTAFMRTALRAASTHSLCRPNGAFARIVFPSDADKPNE